MTGNGNYVNLKKKLIKKVREITLSEVIFGGF